MSRTFVGALALVALTAASAFGDIVDSDLTVWSEGLSRRAPEAGPQLLSFGLPDAPGRIEFDRGGDACGLLAYLPMSPPETGEILTFLRNERDTDKDGFVDSPVVADANPNGYVVFHFRDHWLNERISLGQLLGGDIWDVTMTEGAVPLIQLDEGGQDDGRDPDVPEPSMIAIFLLTLPAALKRRRRATHS